MNGIKLYDDANQLFRGDEYTIDALDEDTSVSVSFVPAIYKLSYEAGAFGTISAVYSDDAEEITSGTSLFGDTGITFTATPDKDCFVKEWCINGDIVKDIDGRIYTGTTYKINSLPGNVHVTVIFGQKGRYFINTETLIASGDKAYGCKLEVSGAEYDADTYMALEGSSLEFTAIPIKNARITEWRQYVDSGEFVDDSGRSYDLLADSRSGNLTTYTVEKITDDLDIAAVFFSADGSLYAFGLEVSVDKSIEIIDLTGNAFEARVPQAALAVALAGNSQSLTIETPGADITLDAAALEAVQNSGGNDDLVITIKVLNTKTLNLIMQNLVDDRPAIEISTALGNRWFEDFGGGGATISVPYMLTDSETVDNIFVISPSDGVIVDVNANDDSLVFRTAKLGAFVVVHNPIEMDDTDGHIFETAINYASSRGSIPTVQDGLFISNSPITRGQFIMGLGKQHGVDPWSYTGEPPYSDVSEDDVIAPYVMWAYQNGIISDTDSDLFLPNYMLAWEDMILMLHNYAILRT